MPRIIWQLGDGTSIVQQIDTALGSTSWRTGTGGGTASETFKSVAIAGSETLEADSVSDVLTFQGGSGVLLTGDAANDRITVAVTFGGSGASTLAARSDHNHTGVYSTVDHTHPGVYAAAVHNHDGVYADIDHVGAGGSAHALATTSTAGFVVLDPVASPEELVSGSSGDSVRRMTVDDVVTLATTHGGAGDTLIVMSSGGAVPGDTLVDATTGVLQPTVNLEIGGVEIGNRGTLNFTPAGAAVIDAVDDAPNDRLTISLGADVVSAGRSALKAITPSGVAEGAIRLMSGWASAHDGVGGAFRWDPASTLTDNAATVVQPDAGGTGRWRRLDAGTLNAQWFGARGDGTTDDAAALNAAATAARAGNKVLFVPAGTYKVNSAVDVTNVDLVGAGRDATVFDVTGFTTTSSPAIYAAGSAASATTLSAGATIGAWSITVADDTGIAVGDWLVIYNSTDYSWSGFRSYYRAGEHVLVNAKLGGGVLRLAAPIYDTYAIGVAVYKVTPGRFTGRDFSVVGSPSTSQYCFSLTYCLDALLERVTLRGSKNAVATISRSVNTVIRDALVASDDATGDGTAYGLALLNVGRTRVYNGRFMSARHGIAIGGDAYVCSVPNRDIVIVGSWLTSVKERSGDQHGNVEACGYIDCLLEGGALLGGHRCFYRGCTIKPPVDGAGFPMALGGTELLSLDHEISGCTIIGRSQNTAYASCIDIGGNNSPMTSNTVRPGVLRVLDTRLIVANGATSLYACYVRNRGSTATSSIYVDGVTLDEEGGGDVVECLFSADVVSGSFWKSVTLRGLRGVAGRKAAVSVVNADLAVFDNIAGTTKAAASSFRRGIYAKDCLRVAIRGCHMDTCTWEGILCDQTSGSAMAVDISDCTVTGCVTTDGGIATFDRAQVVVRSASGSANIRGVTCSSKGALGLRDLHLYAIGTAYVKDCLFLSDAGATYGSVYLYNAPTVYWGGTVLHDLPTTGGTGTPVEYGDYQYGAGLYFKGIPTSSPGTDGVYVASGALMKG